MLEIKKTAKDFVSNQKISPSLFDASGNTIVRVICEDLCYEDVNTLENSICSYMNSFMTDGVEVKTDHVTIKQYSGEDAKGRYIKEIEFQVFIGDATSVS